MTDVARRARERDMDVSADPATRVAAYRSLLRTDRMCEACEDGYVGPSKRRGSDIRPGPLSPCSKCFRSGHVLRWRFELAAYAGDPVARAALNESWLGVGAERGVVDFYLWMGGFLRWGHEAHGVAAEAAGARPDDGARGSRGYQIYYEEYPEEQIAWQRAARPKVTAAVTAYALDAAALRQREG